MALAKLSLRWQIVLGTAALILVLGAVSVLVLWRELEEEVSVQLDRRAQAKAAQLAELAVDRVITGRRLTLNLLVAEFAESNPEIAFAYVLDADGKVLAHSFLGGFPVGLLDADAPHNRAEGEIRVIDTELGIVHEASAPMLRGTAGQVRVGLSSEETRRAHVRTLLSFTAVFILVLLLGMAATAWYSLRIVRPILAAADAARAIAAGELDVRVDTPALGEVAELGAAFNAMAADLRRSKEALLSAKELSDNVLNSLHDALLVLAPDGRIREANPAACGLLGYTREELAGQSASALLDAGAGSADPDFLGTYRNVETSLLARDGRRVPVLLSASVMRGPSGEVHGAVWAARPH